MRRRGALAVQVEPSAGKMSVSGAEFSVILTNSDGVTSSVPTGVYTVEARWTNKQQWESSATRGTAGSFL
jgi:hypothetical protein